VIASANYYDLGLIGDKSVPFQNCGPR